MYVHPTLIFFSFTSCNVVTFALPTYNVLKRLSCFIVLFSWTLNIQKHKKSFGITFHAFSTETWNIAIYSKVIDMIRRWVAEGRMKTSAVFPAHHCSSFSSSRHRESFFFFSAVWSFDGNIDSESFDGSSKSTVNQRPRTVTLCWMLSAKILSKVTKDHLFLIFIQIDLLNIFYFSQRLIRNYMSLKLVWTLNPISDLKSKLFDVESN